MTVHNWILEVVASRSINQTDKLLAVELATHLLDDPPPRPLEANTGTIYSLASDLGVRFFAPTSPAQPDIAAALG